MSDYVTRLLGRVQGTAPVVEPRLRARFEDAAGGFDPSPEGLEVATEIDAPDRRPEGASRRSDDVDTRPTASNTAASAAAARSNATSIDADRSAPEAVPNRDRPFIEIEAPPVDLDAPRAQTFVREAAADRAPEARAAHEIPRDGRTEPSNREPPAPWASSNEAPKRPRHPDPHRANETSRPRPSIPAIDDEGATTVRVTIGRIEVRTASPSVPAGEPKRRERNEGVLTLEEYLRQRREGQR